MSKIQDYQIFRESIKSYIKENPLDIGAKYFMLKDIFRDVEAEYFAQINNEILSEREGGKENNAESV